MSDKDRSKKCESNLIGDEDDASKRDENYDLRCNSDKTDDSYELSCQTKWETGQYRSKNKKDK